MSEETVTLTKSEMNAILKAAYPNDGVIERSWALSQQQKNEHFARERFNKLIADVAAYLDGQAPGTQSAGIYNRDLRALVGSFMIYPEHALKSWREE